MGGELVLSRDEWCGIARLWLDHHRGASECEVTDLRPDAECLLVRFPDGAAYCLNDLGDEIDPPVSERDGLPVVTSAARSTRVWGSVSGGAGSRVERRKTRTPDCRGEAA